MRSDVSVFSKLAVAWTIGSEYCCLSFDGAWAFPHVFSARLDGRDVRRSIKIVPVGRAKNVHA